MCDPVSLGILGVSAAATLGGSAMQASAQSDANSAANAATLAEQQRQKALEAQSTQLLNQNIQHDADPMKQMQAATAARAAAYQSILPPAATGKDYTPGAAAAPSIIANDAAARAGGVNARTASDASAKSRGAALGDVLFGDNIANTRANQGIFSIDNTRNRSLNILPTELQAAQLKARSPLGDLLVGLGGLGASAAGMGIGKGASAASPGIYNGQGRGWSPSQTGSGGIFNWSF